MSGEHSDMEGRVLDVMRGSVHDGPGIRTTVFLKGCPLHCIWCHNPESQSREIELSFIAERCVSCGACQRACSSGVHRVESGGHAIDRARCARCGACVDACSAGALELKGRMASVGEVIREVLADRAYYESTGGGMTLSGGEPMAQYDFARALLQEARRQGVHTAVETCGFAPTRQYVEIAPIVDLFLFDCKGVDEALHRRHTGVSNRLILSNLAVLSSLDAAVILRCPLVPGENDTEENLRGIAALAKAHSAIRGVEIMPYHRMGREKGVRAGMDIPFDAPSATPDQKERWIETLRALGVPLLTAC